MPFIQDCGFFVDTMKNNVKLQTLFVFLPNRTIQLTGWEDEVDLRI